MSMTDTSITATRALYIKLGEGGRWAQLAFESGTLRFGFRDIPHEQALAAAAANDFLFVKDFYKRKGVAPGTATRYANEVRNFYTADADVLWITFANGRMWWCFADTEVIPTTALDPDETGSRYRKSIGGWKDKDLAEQTLWTNSLRGSLTTTAGFRGTICRVREFDYLLRRLNGQETLATKAVREARLTLIETLTPLIRGLYWKDFELLVELVMTQGGWRRVSETGGTQKTIDLELWIDPDGAWSSPEKPFPTARDSLTLRMHRREAEPFVTESPKLALQDLAHEPGSGEDDAISSTDSDGSDDIIAEGEEEQPAKRCTAAEIALGGRLVRGQLP